MVTSAPAALGPSPWHAGDVAAYRSGLLLAGRYELVRAAGQGGTAIVWVARDSVLDIDVAVKIVLPSTEDISGEMKQRTVQEARLCAQLTDPAVCRVLDFGFTHRGDPFVVSELLEGETLDDCCEREGRLAEVDAVRLLLPILDALGAAHRKGIVHRDVKPGNVFLARSDGRIQPKLLDFGIACSSDLASRTTSTGLICGTPCYMSPEQAYGSGDVDARSDLWSFSVMLYEMVSGIAPFLGDTYHATLYAIASERVPSLASLGYDERLSKIVERGMEKEREARWASAAELANALSRWLVERGLESDASGLSLRRRFLDAQDSGELREDVSSARGVSFSLGHGERQLAAERLGPKGWLVSGLFGLTFGAALVGLALVQRGFRAETEAQPPAIVAPAVPVAPRAAPAPAPAATGARTEAPVVRPLPATAGAARGDSRDLAPKPATPTRAGVRRAKKPSASLYELIPPPPPPAASAPAPVVVESPAPRKTTPAKAPVRTRPSPRNALRYDFGL